VEDRRRLHRHSPAASLNHPFLRLAAPDPPVEIQRRKISKKFRGVHDSTGTVLLPGAPSRVGLPSANLSARQSALRPLVGTKRPTAPARLVRVSDDRGRRRACLRLGRPTSPLPPRSLRLPTSSVLSTSFCIVLLSLTTSIYLYPA